jgi:hypothetical protein
MSITVPNYSLPLLKKVENNVADQLAHLQGITSVEMVNLGELVDYIMADLKGPFVSRSKSRASLKSILLYYLGKPLDADLRRSLARHIAGNQSLISEGKVFAPWNPHCKPVWACLHITAAERLCMDKKKYNVELESFAGPSVNRIWEKTMSAAFMQYMLRTIGGNKYGKYEEEDLYNLWFTAAIKGSPTGLQLDYIHVSSSQKGHNSKLLKARQGECIGGFTKGKCIVCPLGIDRCSLARHEYTYTLGVCRNVLPKAHKGYIERHGYCMFCMQKGRYVKEDKARDVAGPSLLEESITREGIVGVQAEITAGVESPLGSTSSDNCSAPDKQECSIEANNG